jgi:phosphoglycerate dehydrogenase-like enzyme
MTTINTHILTSPEPDHLDYLLSLLDDGFCITTGADVPPETQILVAGRPTRDHLKSCPDLHTLVIPFAGLPVETRELMAGFPHINVHNLHHNAPMTAEMALALLLAAAKNTVPVDQALRKHDWSPRYTSTPPNFVLEGKTALILGYGSIGRRVGAACRGLGMTVQGIRRNPGDEPGVYALDALPALLPQAQVFIICVPGTPDTEGLIGEAELALLPDGAILVNVGRGYVVDEGALYRALKKRHLHAAGLDVWYNYPTRLESHLMGEESYRNTPPSAYPFHELDNVVMSPHRAGGAGTYEVELRRMKALAQFLTIAASGQPLPHLVDIEAGY